MEDETFGENKENPEQKHLFASAKKHWEYYNVLRFGAIMKPSFMTRSSSMSGMHFEAPLSKQQLLLYFERRDLSSPLFLSSFQLAFASFFTSPMGLRTYEGEEEADSPSTKFQGVRTRKWLCLYFYILNKTISWKHFPRTSSFPSMPVSITRGYFLLSF